MQYAHVLKFAGAIKRCKETPDEKDCAYTINIIVFSGQFGLIHGRLYVSICPVAAMYAGTTSEIREKYPTAANHDLIDKIFISM